MPEKLVQETDGLTILGRTVRPSDYTERRLETIPCSQDLVDVSLTSDEVTAICPKSEGRDFYQVEVTYLPNGKIVESKSAKYYLSSFANEGIFCEDFAARIARDFYDALLPEHIRVIVTQKSRGGISIKACAVIDEN